LLPCVRAAVHDFQPVERALVPSGSLDRAGVLHGSTNQTMQTADLVDLALLAAVHGPKLVVAEPGQSLRGLEEYWTASKCRFDRWSAALARLRRGEPPADGGRPATVRGLFEEMLGSEVLTRVWTAVVVAFDRRRNTQDNEIIVRSVHIGHQEMRGRVLKLLAGGPGLTASEAVELNRLRRRSEQWTDMLLAFLAATDDVAEFVCEPDRFKGYAADLSSGGIAVAGDRDPAAVLQTTLRSLVRHALLEAAPNADLNERVAAAILSGFPPDLFDHHGLFRSLWLLRLMKTTDDAERWMTDLFGSESSAGPVDPFSRRFN
jgi:hypothetical protein